MNEGQKDQNERIKKYVDALEKTNKHLIIALQKMLEYASKLEEVSKKSIANMKSTNGRSVQSSSEWQHKLIKPTIPLFERILDMSEDDQRSLLKSLEKKSKKG
jgi:translation initiation factor 2 beta subunit (eIF-2beta)/eIF-5